ncbi:MAG: shikimate dehydrogenase [Nitrospinae bacterium]|nr:shikimate dehydrogenase [Nitrospinota bacterium]
MKRSYRLGIIGHPVSHSLSPIMHRLAGEMTELDLTYKAFDVRPDMLEQFISRVTGEYSRSFMGSKDTDWPGAESLSGFNVTVPHKVAVIQYLDGLEPDAARIGAVNTVFRRGDKLIGDNTDGYGFLQSLRENAGTDPGGLRVFMYGAGGAARAVAFALSGAGANLVIANRDGAKAQRLVEELTKAGGAAVTADWNAMNLIDSVRAADIIVNTTTVGMKGSGEGALPAMQGIHEGQLVADIVYRPLNTPLLQFAQTQGVRTLDGLWMLIHQGAASFTRWTGEAFPVEAARARLLAELGESNS